MKGSKLLGLGDFWLQSNNGKKYSLKDLKDLKPEDIAKNPKLQKFINLFDLDGNGTINGQNEWKSIFTDLQKAAVDNNLTSEEFGLYISEKMPNEDLKLEDVNELLDLATKKSDTEENPSFADILMESGVVQPAIAENELNKIKTEAFNTVLTSTFVTENIDTEYENLYVFAKDKLSKAGKKPTIEEIALYAAELQILNPDIKADKKVEKGTSINLPAKSIDKKNLQLLATKGIEVEKDNYIFFQKLLELDDQKQAYVFNAIKNSKFNTKEEVINEVYNKTKINLADTGLTIKVGDTSSTIENFVTKTLNLDLTSKDGLKIYKRLCSLGDDIGSVQRAIDKFPKEFIDKLSKTNNITFDKFADKAEVFGIILRTDEEVKEREKNSQEYRDLKARIFMANYAADNYTSSVTISQNTDRELNFTQGSWWIRNSRPLGFTANEQQKRDIAKAEQLRKLVLDADTLSNEEFAKRMSAIMEAERTAYSPGAVGAPVAAMSNSFEIKDQSFTFEPELAYKFMKQLQSAELAASIAKRLEPQKKENIQDNPDLIPLESTRVYNAQKEVVGIEYTVKPLNKNEIEQLKQYIKTIKTRKELFLFAKSLHYKTNILDNEVKTMIQHEYQEEISKLIETKAKALGYAESDKPNHISLNTFKDIFSNPIDKKRNYPKTNEKTMMEIFESTKTKLLGGWNPIKQEIKNQELEGTFGGVLDIAAMILITKGMGSMGTFVRIGNVGRSVGAATNIYRTADAVSKITKNAKLINNLAKADKVLSGLWINGTAGALHGAATMGAYGVLQGSASLINNIVENIKEGKVWSDGLDERFKQTLLMGYENAKFGFFAGYSGVLAQALGKGTTALGAKGIDKLFKTNYSKSVVQKVSNVVTEEGISGSEFFAKMHEASKAEGLIGFGYETGFFTLYHKLEEAGVDFNNEESLLSAIESNLDEETKQSLGATYLSEGKNLAMFKIIGSLIQWVHIGKLSSTAAMEIQANNNRALKNMNMKKVVENGKESYLVKFNENDKPIKCAPEQLLQLCEQKMFYADIEDKVQKDGKFKLPSNQTIEFDKEKNVYRTIVDTENTVEAASVEDLLNQVNQIAFKNQIDEQLSKENKVELNNDMTLTKVDGKYQIEITLEDGKKIPVQSEDLNDVIMQSQAINLIFRTIGTQDKNINETQTKTNILSDIQKYIEGYKQYGEEYMPEDLDENSVFAEFLRYRQSKCKENPMLNIYKVINPKDSDNPQIRLATMQELETFMLEKSEFATKEDYYALVEENAKIVAENAEKKNNLRPEFAQYAAQLYKWRAYTAGQASGEKLPDGSYSLKQSRLFDQQKNDQAVKEYIEFLENITGKKVLYDNTARFNELIDMTGLLNSPEMFANVDYIIISHGTGNSRITDKSSDYWRFKHSGKSVFEFLEENVPEGKNALMFVCEHDGLNREERRKDENMYDRNGNYMFAIGGPAGGTKDQPIKICTSGIRHITGSIDPGNNVTYINLSNNGFKGLVIKNPKTIMYDFDYDNYKTPQNKSAAEEKSENHTDKVKPEQLEYARKQGTGDSEKNRSHSGFERVWQRLQEMRELQDLSGEERFIQFLKLYNPKEYDKLQQNPQLLQTREYQEQIADLDKWYSIKDTIEDCNDLKGTEKAEELYENYLQNEFVSKNPKTTEHIKDLCRLINKDFGVKVFLPSNLKETGVALKLIYQELACYKMHAKANGVEAAFPPTLEFFIINENFVKDKTIVGSCASFGDKHIQIKGLSIATIKNHLRHELAHANELKHLGEFPEGFHPEQYKQIFREANIPDEFIEYSLYSPAEFLATAAQGDMSKYPPKLREALKSIGMPEFILNMPANFTQADIDKVVKANQSFEKHRNNVLAMKLLKEIFGNSKEFAISREAAEVLEAEHKEADVKRYNDEITVFDELEVDIANIQNQNDIDIVKTRLQEQKSELTQEQYTTLKTRLNDCIAKYNNTVTPEKKKGLVLESWEQKSARLEVERRTRVEALDKMKIDNPSPRGKILDSMIDTLDITNEADVARFRELLNDGYMKDSEKEYFTTLLENRLNPPTFENYKPEQIAAEVQHLIRHFKNIDAHIIERLKASGLSELGLVSQRIKSDTSTYDKLFNYINDHKDKSIIDAVKSVRDEFGTRSVIGTGNYSDKPNVKLALDAAKEEGLTPEERRTRLIRAAREAAIYQSEDLLLALQDQMIKQFHDSDGLEGIRMVNYTSIDGIPVLSETQLWELYRFAEELGIEKDHIKIIELKEVKYPNGEIYVQAKDAFTKEVLDSEEYTTHAQKSGYTAFQMNFKTKKGDTLEFQSRDVLTDEFGEAEHLIYDTITGKDIIGRHPKIKSLCNQLLQILDENYLDKNVCKKYRTEYLKDYYTYCRAKSLGIDIGEPKLQEYAERFGKELGIPDLKLDPRLDARNLMALHDIAEAVKNKALSEYEAVELYQKHIEYSQGEVPREMFEADVESFWNEIQEFAPTDIRLEDLKKCSQQDFLVKLEAFKILKNDMTSVEDFDKGPFVYNVIGDISAENYKSVMKMYYYLKEAKIPGNGQNVNLYTATLVKPEASYDARVFFNNTKLNPKLQALPGFYHLIEDASPELIKQRSHVFNFMDKYSNNTHENDLIKMLKNADLYSDTFEKIEYRILFDETLSDAEKDNILKSIPYYSIEPNVLWENFEHVLNYISRSGESEKIPGLCSILNETPPEEKTNATDLFLHQNYSDEYVRTYANFRAAQEKYYKPTPQNKYANKTVLSYLKNTLVTYGFTEKEIADCSVETLSQLYHFVKSKKDGKIPPEEKQILLENNIDKRTPLLNIMPRCYRNKLMLCSDEEYDKLSEKILKRHQYCLNQDMTEENIDKLIAMSDEKYNNFNQLLSLLYKKVSSNDELTTILNLSDAEFDNLPKRLDYFKSNNLTAKQIIILLKLSDKEFEKKKTNLPDRPVEEDIDPEAYRAEVQAKLDGTYELDLSAYNKSRAKIAAEQAKKDRFITRIPFNEKDAIIPTPKAEASTEIPTSEQLIEQLQNTGSVSVSIPVKEELHPKGDDTNGRIEPERELGAFSTKITLHYGEGRDWDNSRFARDMLQNFYDGNGHTLEGVDIDIKFENGKYKVKISGKGIYDYKQVFKLGKNNHDSLDAGKYGEGMKVMFATLLDSRGSTYVKHSSGDWTINLTAEEGARTSSRTRVFGDLQRAETRQQGSSVEFDTTDAELVQELLKAKDYFYTPYNPDFKNLDYENEYFGIKFLPKDEKGNIYVVQRYEVGSTEHSGLDDTLDGMTLVFKVMPDNPAITSQKWNNYEFKLETGRNRVPLTNTEIYQLVRRYAMTIPDADLIKIIGSMKDFYLNPKEANKYMTAHRILDAFALAAYLKNLKIDFGNDNYVAVNNQTSSENINFASSYGKTIVSESMEKVGVPSISQYFADDKKDVLPEAHPTEVQANKIKLIDEAVKLFTENLDIENLDIVTPTEASNPRYLFEKPERDKNTNELAEAITDNNNSLGMWISKQYIDYPFTDIFRYIATWLHEISHKVGGDGEKIFNIRLQKLIQLTTQMCEKDPAFRTKLQVLNEEFKKLNGNNPTETTLPIEFSSEEFKARMEQSLRWLVEDPELPGSVKLPEDYKPTTLDYVANQTDKYLRKFKKWLNNNISDNKSKQETRPTEKYTIDVHVYSEPKYIPKTNFELKYEDEIPTNEKTSIQSAKSAEKELQEIIEAGNKTFEMAPLTDRKPKIEFSGIEENDRARYEACKIEESQMTLNYNSSNSWSLQQVARDMLQNLSDGHRGTLDGVKFDIQYDGTKFKVRISGQSEYEYFHIENLGASGEEGLNNGTKNGGFGEGAKMVPLHLLYSKLVDKYTYSSGDWKIDFTRQKDSNGDELPVDEGYMMMTPSINKNRVFGNYVEFETSDQNLIKAILEARDYFYHSENPDFKNFDIETPDMGLCILPEGERGNLYYNQRYSIKGEDSNNRSEFDNTLDGLRIVFKRTLSKKELTASLLSKDCDRLGLSKYDVQKIAGRLCASMSNEQLMDAITRLQRYWIYKEVPTDRYKDNSFEQYFVYGLLYQARNRGLSFNNAESLKIVSKDAKNYNEAKAKELMRRGYKIADNLMSYMGIPTINDVFDNVMRIEPHEASELTLSEQQKIVMLEYALGISRTSIQKGFQAAIVTFDSSEYQDNVEFYTRDCKEFNIKLPYLAIDREFLRKSDFSTCYNALISQLRRKSSDTEANFGYQLTTLISDQLRELSKPEYAERLRYIEEEYNKIQ